MLSLLFFNWYGYRILTSIMEGQADVKLEARLDRNDYDESQLIELRVPINLPYHNDWKEFERYNGSIEINGVHYNYVKRKVEKGELVLLCLPNDEKQMVQSARDQFFKLVNDLQQPGANKKSDPGNSIAFKNLFSEYQKEKNNWQIEILMAARVTAAPMADLINSQYWGESPEQPPEMV